MDSKFCIRQDSKGVGHVGCYGRISGCPDARTSKVVGVATGPFLSEPVIYDNCVANIVAAGKERTDEKTISFPFSPTGDDKKKIGEMLAQARGYKGNKKYYVSSIEQIDDEMEKVFHFSQFGSKKWTDKRFENTFNHLLHQVDPRFKTKAKIKLEPMGRKPDGSVKPPRLLIADGDHGQIMSLLVIAIFGRLLFKKYHTRSIKGRSRRKAPQDVVDCLRPSKKQVGSTLSGPKAPMVEGDGSAWDSCCSKELRDMVENPVLRHISTHLLEYYMVPPQWEKEHSQMNTVDRYNLDFKDKLMTYFIQLKAIRQSGHRGTSSLNWWVNLVMWCCSISSNPWVLLFERQDSCKGIDGKNLWIRIVLDGDDSLARICRAFGDVAEDERTMYFLHFWKRMGFDMKIRRCGVSPDQKPYAEFVGTHFLLDEQLDLEGTYVPDPRHATGI